MCSIAHPFIKSLPLPWYDWITFDKKDLKLHVIQTPWGFFLRNNFIVTAACVSAVYQQEQASPYYLTLKLKGRRKVSQKGYHFIMVLCIYYVIMYVTWGISFDEISVSQDCCITWLWHTINKYYVFKKFWLYGITRSSLKIVFSWVRT